MLPPRISRRGFLAAAGALTTAAAGACRTAPPAGKPERLLRLAHLTDIHVEARPEARAGMARALAHAQAQADPRPSS